MWFLFGEVSSFSGAWDGLRYFDIDPRVLHILFFSFMLTDLFRLQKYQQRKAR